MSRQGRPGGGDLRGHKGRRFEKPVLQCPGTFVLKDGTIAADAALSFSDDDSTGTRSPAVRARMRESGVRVLFQPANPPIATDEPACLFSVDRPGDNQREP